MTVLDIGIIIVYLAVLLYIGVHVSKSVKTNEDSVLAGRSFGSFFAAVGKTANLAGGSTSVGGAAYGYTFGISGSWFGISNVLAMWITAPVATRMWKAMHRGRLASIGGYLGYRFGTAARVLAGLLNTLAYAGFVASQVVATGTILHVLLGWDLNMSMILTTIVVIIYTILGGLKAVVYTDCMQMAVLFVGMIAVLLPVSLNKVGGVGELMSKVPEAFASMGTMGWYTIIGVILIPTMLAGFTMQAGYSYIGSCKTASAAWKSNIISGFMYAFPAFAVILIGMAALVLYPELSSSQDALPTMILNLLPSGLVGLLLAAILSATMSTSSTCLLCAATCFGVDVLPVLSKKERSPEEMLKITRLTMVAVGALTMAIAILYPQIIDLILIGYSFGAGGLLIPVFAAMFWKRATTPGCIAAMIGGGLSYVVLSNMVAWPPLFASVPISLVLMVIVSLATPKPLESQYDIYFDDTWEKSGKTVQE